MSTKEENQNNNTRTQIRELRKRILLELSSGNITGSSGSSLSSHTTDGIDISLPSDNFGTNAKKMKRIKTETEHSIWQSMRDDEDDTDSIDTETENEEEPTGISIRRRSDHNQSSSIYRRITSPLELPNLLDQILKYLPLRDWKSSRQVNSTWKTICDNSISKYMFNIGHSQSLVTLSQSEWTDIERREMFTNVKLPRCGEFSDFQLVRFLNSNGAYIKCLIIPTMKWRVEDLRSLLFIKCPNVEDLRFIGDIPTDTDPSKRIIEGIGLNLLLPKLKRLSFYISNAHDDSFVAHVFGFFNSATNAWTKNLICDLLSMCPNLEDIKCYNKRNNNDRSICKIVSNETMRSDGDIETSFARVNQYLAQKLFSKIHDSNPKLKNLSMYLRLNSRGLEKLEMKKYPLQTLDLHVRIEDQISMGSLLTSLGNTLKHLRLKVDLRQKLTSECRQLQQLETFHLEDYTGDLRFLQDLSKLHTLILDRFDCRRFLYSSQHPTLWDSKLKSLAVQNLRNEKKQGKFIKRMAVFQPNITELSLNPVTNDDLHRVFDSLSNLEQLKLVSNELSSTGISGFADSDLEFILDNGYEVSRYREYEKYRRFPYIGDLKNLKVFEMVGNMQSLTPYCMKNRMICGMHGLWIFHGVGNLKQLRSLTVQHTGATESDHFTLSSLELKKLAAMDLSKLQLMNCRTAPIAEKWIREKLISKPIEFKLQNFS